MARFGVSTALIALVVLAAVAHVDAGRKMRQISQSSGNGATIASNVATSANINQAIDNKNPPKAGSTPKPLNVNPKPVAAPKKTSKGTAAEGATTYMPSGTAAQINKYASGEKPVQKEAPKAADVTAKISGTSKVFQGTNGAGGQGQALQAGTAAGINSAVDSANKLFDQKSG